MKSIFLGAALAAATVNIASAQTTSIEMPGFVANSLETCPKPVYPAEARQSGREGLVEVMFSVRADGSVTFATVTKSSGHPDLDDAATRSLVRCKLKKPFPGTQLAEIDFKLKDK